MASTVLYETGDKDRRLSPTKKQMKVIEHMLAEHFGAWRLFAVDHNGMKVESIQQNSDMEQATLSDMAMAYEEALEDDD